VAGHAIPNASIRILAQKMVPKGSSELRHGAPAGLDASPTNAHFLFILFASFTPTKMLKMALDKLPSLKYRGKKYFCKSA